MREQEISFPAINDADGRISAAWGVHGVPASFYHRAGRPDTLRRGGLHHQPGIRLPLAGGNMIPDNAARCVLCSCGTIACDDRMRPVSRGQSALQQTYHRA